MAVIALLSFYTTQSHAQEKQPQSAVILTYHRINEDSNPEDNLRLEQFLQHIDEIKSGEYTVLPVPEIIKRIKSGQPLPEHTLGITFEGGYRSAYQNAMPLLLKEKIPFTVFFSSNNADNPSEQYMSWHDLSTLKHTGLVNLGILPASYKRLIQSSRAEIMAQLNKARTAFRDHFQTEPKLFSYPFGERSQAYQKIIETQEFNAAFSLQSGAIHAKSDLYNLPRFSMTENYGSLDRFQLVARARPFYASQITPTDSFIDTPQPAIGFSVSDQVKEDLKNISCFISEIGEVETEQLSNTRIELRLNQDLTQERTRVNCTAPVYEDKEITAWRWFGLLLIQNIKEDQS